MLYVHILYVAIATAFLSQISRDVVKNLMHFVVTK
jgi:hypothetical protein